MSAGRVALGGVTALLLWLGFYALGLVMAGGLLLLPWAQSRYQGAVGLSGVAAGVLALVMLWAIFPRFRPQTLDGRPLGGEQHPRLRALVAAIAARLGMDAPDELYLTIHANAFAAFQARWLGLRGTRAVGVGLPLLVLLDQEELASVAHELGHHHAGHVRLGPWVHRMRRSIAGVLERLEGSSFWLHLPFVLYAHVFMRVTRGTSRIQELHADAMAARACGASATRRALERIHDEGVLWEAYFASEILPLVRQGFSPPLLNGFERFRRAVAVRADVLERIARLRAEEAKPSLLDTHPTLAARLAALGEAPAGGRRGPPALELLDGVDGVERDVIDELLVEGARVKPIDWEDVGELVWVPLWRARLEPYHHLFASCSPSRLAQLIADGERWGAMTRRGLDLLSPAARRQRFTELCGAWLTLDLAHRGFTILAEPGEPIRARRGDVVVDPFVVVGSLERGELSGAQWEARCVEIETD